MTQQISAISEIKIKLPKNAKLFKNNETGLIHLVHYDHVILTLGNYQGKYKILSCYVGSPTSQVAIENTVSHYEIYDRYYCMNDIYRDLGKTDEQRKSDRGDYKASNTGIYNRPRMLKADWQERISALEEYDYTKGTWLWQ